jgi:hippurate hydrolase
MHNWPGLPAGSFAPSPGPVMASANTFKIVIRGKGAHAALPHLGVWIRCWWPARRYGRC